MYIFVLSGTEWNKEIQLGDGIHTTSACKSLWTREDILWIYFLKIFNISLITPKEWMNWCSEHAFVESSQRNSKFKAVCKHYYYLLNCFNFILIVFIALMYRKLSFVFHSILFKWNFEHISSFFVVPFKI